MVTIYASKNTSKSKNCKGERSPLRRRGEPSAAQREEPPASLVPMPLRASGQHPVTGRYKELHPDRGDNSTIGVGGGVGLGARLAVASNRGHGEGRRNHPCTSGCAAGGAWSGQSAHIKKVGCTHISKHIWVDDYPVDSDLDPGPICTHVNAARADFPAFAANWGGIQCTVKTGPVSPC